jgi:hypothetical protein
MLHLNNQWSTDLSNQLFDILSDEDVERIKVRGVIAIGAIAILYYMRQIQKASIPLFPGTLVVISSDDVMLFWSVYVLGVAIALIAGKGSLSTNLLDRVFSILLRVSYVGARAAYLVASGLLVVTVIYRLYFDRLLAPILLVVVLAVLQLKGRQALKNLKGRLRGTG